MSASRAFALLWVFSTAATAWSASAALFSAFMWRYAQTKPTQARFLTQTCVTIKEHSRHCLYRVLKRVDVIGEVPLVLFQLINFGPLVVDGYAVFVHKILQKAQEQKFRRSYSGTVRPERTLICKGHLHPVARPLTCVDA